VCGWGVGVGGMMCVCMCVCVWSFLWGEGGGYVYVCVDRKGGLGGVSDAYLVTFCVRVCVCVCVTWRWMATMGTMTDVSGGRMHDTSPSPSRTTPNAV
jgi:hypothetical protein